MKRSKNILSLLLSLVMALGLLSALTFSSNAEQSLNCLANLECTDEGHYNGNECDSRVFRLDGEYFNGYNPGGYIENGVAVGKRNGNVGVDGTVYENGFEVWIARWNFGDNISWAYRTFKLSGKYHTLTGKSGLIKSYNTKSFDDTVYFYNGSDLIYSFQVTPSNYNNDFTVNVDGVDELKVEIKDNTKAAGGTSFALYDLFLDGNTSSGNRYPNGYDFYEDSYGFVNDQDADISQKYFDAIFESSTAKLAHDEYHNAGGLCYGFALTTASIYNNTPPVSLFAYRTSLIGSELASNIRDLKRDFLWFKNSAAYIDGNFNDCITLSQYIKYAYIYQYSAEATAKLYASSNNALDLLALVKERTDNDLMGVAIGFSRFKGHDSVPGGHEVLAVGYDGNDILIDNPNNSEDLERLTVHADGTWEFGGYNNTDHWLDWDTDFTRPYEIIQTGRRVTADVSSSKNSANETYIVDTDKLSADYNLICVDSSSYSISDNNCILIPYSKSGESAKTKDMLWTKENSIVFSELQGDLNTIKIAGDDTILTTSVPKDSTVSMDKQNSDIVVKTAKNESVELAFETCSLSSDYDNTNVTITVSGNSANGIVTATATEDGIAVDGINEGTITLEINDDIVAEDAISKSNADVDITYDKTGETDTLIVSTDTETPTNTCKYCGKVHDTSFLGKLTSFFHNIFYFFKNLFK